MKMKIIKPHGKNHNFLSFILHLLSFILLKFNADKVRALLEKVAWARRRVRAFLLGAPHSGAALLPSSTFILPPSSFRLPPSSFILFKPLTESQRHGVFFREHRHPAGNINLQISQVIIDRIYMLYRNLFPSAPLRLCASARDLFPMNSALINIGGKNEKNS